MATVIAPHPALPAIQAITSAFLLKLTTSLDDLLWLSPFLSLSPSVGNKLKHSIVYFIICVCVTMLAFIFGTSLLALTSSGSSGNGDEPHGYWNPERFLSVFSATVLLYIARNDFLEWKEENLQSSKDRELEEEALEMDTVETLDIGGSKSDNPNLRSRSHVSRTVSADLEAGNDSDDDSDDEEIRAKIEEASKSLRRFVTVCVMGTLDDMIVFSAFVAGGGSGAHLHSNSNSNSSSEAAAAAAGKGTEHSYLALFIGTTFAALLIVTISWFFSEIECFKRMVKKIPMWGLLTGIAVYILAMGLL
eukprot:jgi/Psemu1/284727/fgenesh1_pg.62_\